MNSDYINDFAPIELRQDDKSNIFEIKALFRFLKRINHL
jgi:hypothetical protein